MAATAALGRSAAVPVGPGSGLPPYAAEAAPSAGLVTGLLIAATALGAGGLLACWVALGRGWRPRARPLLLAGCAAALALTFLPHICSADPESYAAYGRMAATGIDPYDTAPAELAARGDPYGAVVESPWQDSPSVYGPVATWEARLAAGLAGEDPRTAVWILGLLGGVAFIGAALLLDRLGRTEAERGRAVLLWTCNPLLLMQLVAGAHLDTIAIVCTVGALAVLRRAPVLAGVLGGAAVAVKLPFALVGGGLAWALRRRLPTLAALGGGALVVLVVAYLSVGSHAFDQTRTASRFVSRSTPWRPLRSALDDLWGATTARAIVTVAAALLAFGLVALLARALPHRAPDGGDATVGVAARAALVLTLGWLLAAPYALPWYDGIAWALIVLLPASAFDLVLLVRTTVLSLAYIPGRDLPLPSSVQSLSDALRDVASPTVLGLLVVTVVVLSATSGRERRT